MMVGSDEFHDEVRMSFRRILIAISGSPLAARAADVGVELARALKADVALLYVVDPAENWAPESGIPAVDLIKIGERDGKKMVAEYCARANLQPPALEFVRTGKPATEIVKAAKDWSADLIVVACHDRGGVSRLLQTGTTEGVMHHSSCPVLIVRGEK
jgi:nucleotide-binding universal stress UspA family protein